MFKFLKESMKEFDHVVWPTNKEAKKYFTIVVSFIVTFTILIYVVWTFFSFVLFYAKDTINPSKIPPITTNNKNAPTSTQTASWSDFDLNKFASGTSVDVWATTVTPSASWAAK